MATEWTKLFKINIREVTDAQTKHLVVKTLIVQKLLIRYKKQKNFIRIYTEFEATEGKLADVYFENNRAKEAYAYEIQSKITPQWLEETKKIYENWEVPFMNTSDLVIVDLNKLSNNLIKLEEQINELIY